MALSYKTRRRLSVLILLFGLPAYIVAAIVLVAQFDRPPFILELVIYVVLGIVWILPFKFVFRGVGQPDPESVDRDLANSSNASDVPAETTDTPDI
ncbi:MAG: hypothetical protein ACI861_002694 [Paracoccaceae bacterium]|jgi:hypothetical protein